MLIGGAIAGAVPLVIIGFVIGIIGMICAKFLSIALEEEYYEKASREFGAKLDGYPNNGNNDTENKKIIEDVIKELNSVKELIEGKTYLVDLMSWNTELTNWQTVS